MLVRPRPGGVGGIALLALALATPHAPSAPGASNRASRPAPPSPEKLRAEAATAERAGEWEAAFAAYCKLYLADRTAPDVRDKLNAVLRRVQQARRHRDPPFVRFTTGLNVTDSLTLYAEVVGKVSAVAADRDRATPQQLWENGVEELDRALGLPGFRRQYLGTVAADRVESFRQSLRTFWAKRPVATPREARAQLRHLTAAAQETIPVRVPAAVVVEFVCGACAGLDEYTVFLSPAASAAETLADLSPYGVSVAFRDSGLFVDEIAPNSWAALHTTLRKGDRIVRVNERPTDAAGPPTLAEALQMPVGNAHTVQIVVPVPDLPATVEFPLAVPTVYGGRILMTGRDGIGYLRLGSFRDTTAREIDDAVRNLTDRNGLRVLILDLRGNHGGLFSAGVAVAQRFLAGGIIVTTQGQVGEFANRVFSSDSGMTAFDVPLVLLIDAETASAAEIVAAAFKDNGRATLVGMPSFGKGAVQHPFKLMSLDDLDNLGRVRPKTGTVRVTIARLFSPRGVALNGNGVVPHLLEPDAQRQLEIAIERALDLLPTAPPPVPRPLNP
jgi:C-terminal peptidase prc